MIAKDKQTIHCALTIMLLLTFFFFLFVLTHYDRNCHFHSLYLSWLCYKILLILYRRISNQLLYTDKLLTSPSKGINSRVYFLFGVQET
jgi:hypothetical protein